MFRCRFRSPESLRPESEIASDLVEKTKNPVRVSSVASISLHLRLPLRGVGDPGGRAPVSDGGPYGSPKFLEVHDARRRDSLALQVSAAGLASIMWIMRLSQRRCKGDPMVQVFSI